MRELLSGRSSAVAPLLLGSTLVSDLGGERVGVRVSEVEAYEGADDPASHAFGGPTGRNRIMFGPPGFVYVYFVYGMHWCANVVCGEEGTSSAVLVRAGAVVEGLAAARSRRPASRRDVDLARGPARLASALAITGDANGLDLCAPTSPLRLELPAPGPAAAIASGPRVGINVARDVPLRFWSPDDPTVSAYRRGVRKRPRPSGQT